MARGHDPKEFSANRLNGEPVPEDVKALLAHADELAERTGIALHSAKGWAPWGDVSYLNEADRANPGIMANVRAIAEVCEMIAFIAAHEDDEYFGYWRGPERRPVAASPLVRLDNEGQFSFCAGPSFAEAVLGEVSEEQFAELRDWMRSIGVEVKADSQHDLTHPEGVPSPGELHRELYDRYRKEACG